MAGSQDGQANLYMYWQWHESLSKHGGQDSRKKRACAPGTKGSEGNVFLPNKRKGIGGVVVKRTRWKRVLAMVIAVLLLFVLYVANALGGNPISKALVRNQVLKFYEEAYGEDFIVYAGGYNMKIPAYVFEIGPQQNEEIRFDTSLYTMGISDVYGGILAGKLLADDIQKIIEREYPGVQFTIEAREDPLTSYPNEEPEYFQTDPVLRVRSNHFIVFIRWTAAEASPDAFRGILDEITNLVSDDLPYGSPHLVLIGTVHSPNGTMLWTEQAKMLFPLF